MNGHINGTDGSNHNGNTKRSPYPASAVAQRTINPIRRIVDKLVINKSLPPSKYLIPLSLGDPTIFNNLLPPTTLIDTLHNLLNTYTGNGYQSSLGTLDARTAIATKYNTNKQYPITANDVCITSGASHALLLAIQAILHENDEILLPCPGFSLYHTITEHLHRKSVFYNLVPERDWEIDLIDLQSKVTKNTKILLINNPGNPTGSNYSKQHLCDILSFAEQYNLIVISDEIYEHMCFTGQTFTPLCDLSTNVPIITIGGIAKKYVVPGYRVGWLILYDRHNMLQYIRSAIESLSQLIVGCNTLIQFALPNLLLHTDTLYYSTMMQTLETNAMYLYNRLLKIPCFNVIKPQAAMYLMCQIKLHMFQKHTAITDDTTFCAQLLKDQNVILLPGACFIAKNYVRLVFCAPVHILSDACDRIEEFCKQHCNIDNGTQHIDGINKSIANKLSNGVAHSNGAPHNQPSVQYDPIDET